MEHIDVSQQVIQSKMEMATLAEENQELKHELTVTRQEMKKMEDHNGSELDELANENARLVKINSDLQDKLAEMEATLINYKVKYAESENKYEQMLQKLQQLQSLTED
jgi:predicted  nucleic acid-binding Zn-ribbon protein